MSNYPPGSMYGSGIYGDVVSLELECTDCDFEGTVDVVTDDWGHVGTWSCPDCKHDQEVDLRDYYGPDPDDAYDRMRDERSGIF